MMARHFAYGDTHVVDYINMTPLLDNATTRPLHDFIMHTEATRVAQMCYIVTRLGCPPRSIKCVKTDAIIISVPTRRRASLKAVGTLRYEQLHALRRDHELASDPAQGFLNAHVEMTPIHSGDTVFRFSETGRCLQGMYKKPNREVPPPKPQSSWCELTREDAERTVLGGHGLYVCGSPGSGKSYTVREFVKALRANGKRVQIIAKTHASVQNFGEGAVTADHWVRQYVRAGGGRAIRHSSHRGDHAARGPALGRHL